MSVSKVGAGNAGGHIHKATVHQSNSARSLQEAQRPFVMANNSHRRRSLQLDAYERSSLAQQSASVTLYTPYSQTRRRRTSLDNPSSRRDNAHPGASSVVAHSPVAGTDPFSRISDGSGDEASSASVAVIAEHEEMMQTDTPQPPVEGLHFKIGRTPQDGVRDISRAPALALEEQRLRQQREQQLPSSPWTATPSVPTAVADDPWGRPAGLQDFVNGTDFAGALQPAGLMQARAAMISDSQRAPPNHWPDLENGPQ